MGIKEGIIIESMENVPPELKRLVQKHDPKQIAMGISIERVHDGGVTDVTKSQTDILKIALAHLEEDPEYYTHLKAMEDKYKNEWKTMHNALKRGLMEHKRSVTKHFTLEEGSGILSEAPHISVGDKTIDLEFEQGKLNGLRRVLNALLGNQITDKYGNKFRLENPKETTMFLKALAKNAQFKSELK